MILLELIAVTHLIDAKMLIGEDLVRKAAIHVIRTAGIEYYPEKSCARLHVDPFDYETKTIPVEAESTIEFIRSASNVIRGVNALARSGYLPVNKNPFRLSRSKVVRSRRDLPSWNYARGSYEPLDDS